MSTQKKLRTAFFILASVIVTATSAGLLYLQSESFGQVVKRLISERSPRKLGIIGDFSHLNLYLFPPGVGVVDPRIRVERENVSHLPLEGQIEAKELRVSFAPIQMFSGTLRVSEVEVRSGKVEGRILPVTRKGKGSDKPVRLDWQDLFQLRIDGFRFIDTRLDLALTLPGSAGQELGAELKVKDLSLGKGVVGGREGVVSMGEVESLRLRPPPEWKSFPVREAASLSWRVGINDTGLDLAPFAAVASGVRIELKGRIEGNLLDPDSAPKIVAEARADADLATFLNAHLGMKEGIGEVRVEATIQAALRDFMKTLKARYRLEGRGIAWRKVHAEQVSSKGVIDLGTKHLELSQLEIIDGVAKQGTGRVKIENARIPLSFRESFDVELGIENGEIHWLGGLVPGPMAPLEGVLNGKVGARFVPEKNGWKLKSRLGLSVAGFELTNQTLDRPRPLMRILRPPRPILLEGGLEISPDGVEFKDLGVSIEKTRFKVTGGVQAERGLDFFAKGPVQMKEIHEIAGSRIAGEGELIAHIHGKPDAVVLDFDTRINDAEYLDLKLGKLKGRVTYDDGLSELRFTGIHASHKNTYYSLAQGSIDLSGSDELYLPVEIHSGRIEDLAEILGSLISKIEWYPKALRGEVHGNLEIGGKLQLPEMTIAARIEGSDWIWLGEKARRVKMSLGFDRGTYYARDSVITKSSGVIKGGVEFVAATEELKWDFRTEMFSFADLDFLERLEIPARSRVEVASSGSGRMGHLRSKTEGKFFDTRIKGERFESSRFTLETGENTLRATAAIFGDQLSAQWKLALIPRQPSSLRIDLDRFDFTPLLLILNPKLLDDLALLGVVSGHLSLDFLSTQAELARGEWSLDRFELLKTGTSMRLKRPFSVPIQLGYFQIPEVVFQFKDSEVSLRGEGRRGDVDVRIGGTADFSLAEFLNPAVVAAKGKVLSDIRLHGPLKSLRLDGELELSGGGLNLKFLQSPVEDLDGTIRIQQGNVLFENLEGFLGEEVVSFGGRILTFTDRFPDLDLRVQLDNNKIKMDPLDLIQPKGILAIRGKEPPYLITGALEVSQALWTRSFSKSSAAGGSRGDRFLPRDLEKRTSGGFFVMDLGVTAPQGFLVRNEILDAEFKGKARLVGEPESPKLLGEGQLVQGRVLFKDRPFAFESAKIVFDDPYSINPRFTATAVCEVNQYKIRVLASGRSSQWKLEFSSTPFLPENEIFTVLSSGAATADTGRFQTRDRSLVNQGEAASLILHSMDFSKDVQKKTGFQFDVQEAVDNQAATSIFRPQNLSENMAAPKLVLKRKVGRNWSFSFGSTVGIGSRSQREVNAEYKVSSGVSMMGVWNNIEEANSRETRTSFGLDLKLNRRFK